MSTIGIRYVMTRPHPQILDGQKKDVNEQFGPMGLLPKNIVLIRQIGPQMPFHGGKDAAK